jgi:integration host factor subunit beta
MIQSLVGGRRIDLCGFGSFEVKYRPPRTGRNPKIGDLVPVPGKFVRHFKGGTELRGRLNTRK